MPACRPRAALGIAFWGSLFLRFVLRWRGFFGGKGLVLHRLGGMFLSRRGLAVELHMRGLARRFLRPCGFALNAFEGRQALQRFLLFFFAAFCLSPLSSSPDCSAQAAQTALLSSLSFGFIRTS